MNLRMTNRNGRLLLEVTGVEASVAYGPLYSYRMPGSGGGVTTLTGISNVIEGVRSWAKSAVVTGTLPELPGK